MPLLLGIIVSGVCFCVAVVPEAIQYPMRYLNQREHYKSIENMLRLIPGDASASASTFYTVPLANRDILYDVRYSSKEHLLSTEYVVLEIDQKGSYAGYEESGEDGYDNLTALLEENGYTAIAELEDTLIIYSKDIS